MSKSLNNYVGVNDAPGLMYTKLLSLPDGMIWRYFELLSFKSMKEIDALRLDVQSGRNPQEVKDLFAREIIERFHGVEAAAGAHKSAGNRVGLGEVPDDVPEIELDAESQAELPISAILRMAGLVKNGAAAKDVLGRGAVYVNGEKVDATFKQVTIKQRVVIQAGKKKIARIIFK
jgi:tyrosyl-tRNA synthetase